MSAVTEAQQLLCNYYLNSKIKSSADIITNIDTLLAILPVTEFYAIQLKFLRLCLKQIYLYKPCNDCGTDIIGVAHRPIDHLKQWFLQMMSSCKTFFPPQLFHNETDELLKINVYLDSVKDFIAYSMALTIAPAIHYRTAVGKIPHVLRHYADAEAAMRYIRYESEKTWLASLRNLTNHSSSIYLRICGDYRFMGHVIKETKFPLYMHSFYGADCRGIDMYQSYLYFDPRKLAIQPSTAYANELLEHSHQMQYTDLSYADLSYAELSYLHFPPNESEHSLLHMANLSYSRICYTERAILIDSQVIGLETASYPAPPNNCQIL